MKTQQLEGIVSKQKELNITDFLKGKFKYDNYGQYIWLVEPNGNHQKIADIRGWGRIQHFFMDKKGRLDEKKAGEFQDKCGEWVVNALNKALESELSRLKEENLHECMAEARVYEGDKEKEEEPPKYPTSWRDFTMTDKLPDPKDVNPYDARSAKRIHDHFKRK